MKYSISRKALQDIEEIWLYTYENWSLEQADRYYNLIMDEVSYSAHNFESARSMDHIKKGYKASRVKAHIIFFRKNKHNIFEIIRVLHQHMDIENRLG